jgi:hypothetical protein
MLILRRILQSTPAELALVATAWLALWRARARLWLQKSPDLSPPALRRPLQQADAAEGRVAAVSRAVVRASRLVPAPTCLAQAIAARDLLARRGVATDLRLGVARDDLGRMSAHAWLEHQGRVVLGASERTYSALS